jgi:hypothetical protein
MAAIALHAWFDAFPVYGCVTPETSGCLELWQASSRSLGDFARKWIAFVSDRDIKTGQCAEIADPGFI